MYVSDVVYYHTNDFLIKPEKKKHSSEKLFQLNTKIVPSCIVNNNPHNINALAPYVFVFTVDFCFLSYPFNSFSNYIADI